MTLRGDTDADSGGLWRILSGNRTITLDGSPENLGEIPRRFGSFVQWIAGVIGVVGLGGITFELLRRKRPRYWIVYLG
jgi:hypothetical protein